MLLSTFILGQLHIKSATLLIPNVFITLFVVENFTILRTKVAPFFLTDMEKNFCCLHSFLHFLPQNLYLQFLPLLVAKPVIGIGCIACTYSAFYFLPQSLYLQLFPLLGDLEGGLPVERLASEGLGTGRIAWLKTAESSIVSVVSLFCLSVGLWLV